MNSKILLGTLLAASLVGNASFVVTALRARQAAHARAIDRLALTAEQASRFERARSAFQGERARSHLRMDELREALADELAKAAPDRQRLVDTSLEMARLQTDMRPKLVDHLLELHALLTPAQRAALVEVVRAGGGFGAGAGAGASAACPGSSLFTAPGQPGGATP